MEVDEIKKIIKENISDNKKLSLIDLLKIKKTANIELNINRDNGDYYYEVKLNELVDKDFDFNVLKENNWILSKDEKSILLYI